MVEKFDFAAFMQKPNLKELRIIVQFVCNRDLDWDINLIGMDKLRKRVKQLEEWLKGNKPEKLRVRVYRDWDGGEY
jgi:hypothetical protein